MISFNSSCDETLVEVSVDFIPTIQMMCVCVCECVCVCVKEMFCSGFGRVVNGYRLGVIGDLNGCRQSAIMRISATNI